jgi:S-disulfanyl-L-cysteine oxidoreductase SoxD
VAQQGGKLRGDRVDRTTLTLAAVMGGLFLGFLLSAAYAFMPGARADARPLIDWRDDAAVGRGRDLYAAQCASCHGAPGQRGGAPASAALLNGSGGQAWQHPDFSLFQLTKAGVSPETCRSLSEAMPRFGETLDDAEIAAVLAYVKSTWPADIRRYQDEVNHIYAGSNALLRQELRLP